MVGLAVPVFVGALLAAPSSLNCHADQTGMPKIMTKAYDEVLNFLASGHSPAEIIAFRPSEEAQARVYDLMAREKRDGLTAEETVELDHYAQLEHLMRMVKARARSFKPA